MVDVNGIAAADSTDDGKSDQTRSTGDQNAMMNLVHAG